MRKILKKKKMDILLKYEQYQRLDSEDLSNATVNELEDVLTKVGTEIVVINAQLTDAKNRVYASGDYSDRDWFKNAQLAKKLKGILVQKIQMHIGRKKKEEKAENYRIQIELTEKRKEEKKLNHLKNSLTFEKFLLQAMDIYLSPTVKEKIKAKAKELQEQAQISVSV